MLQYHPDKVLSQAASPGGVSFTREQLEMLSKRLMAARDSLKAIAS